MGCVAPEDEPHKTKQWLSQMTELKIDPKLASSSDNLLLSFNYVQNEADTPYLDVRGIDDENDETKENKEKPKPK
jgi:hypothetical protein